MNSERIEEIREFLNQPGRRYEEVPGIALELLEAVDELENVKARLRYALGVQSHYWKRVSVYRPTLVRIQRDKIRDALAWSK